MMRRPLAAKKSSAVAGSDEHNRICPATGNKWWLLVAVPAERDVSVCSLGQNFAPAHVPAWQAERPAGGV
jgi:hypothetical protein